MLEADELDADHGHVLHVAPVDVQPVAVLHVAAGHSEFETHEVFGKHVASHRHDVRQSTPLLQAPLAQLTVHGPAPHATGDAQLPVPQVTEQLEEREQSIGLRQVPSLQRTVHGPGPQRMVVGQAPDPVHVTSHAVAPVQSTLPLHAFPPQLTRQGIPAGQTTAFTQLPDDVQSIAHTAPSQRPVVHAARHAAAAASENASAAPSGNGAARSTTRASDTAASLPAAPPCRASLAGPPSPPAPPAEAPPLVAAFPEAPARASCPVPPDDAPSKEASKVVLPPASGFEDPPIATKS